MRGGPGGRRCQWIGLLLLADFLHEETVTAAAVSDFQTRTPIRCNPSQQMANAVRPSWRSASTGDLGSHHDPHGRRHMGGFRVMPEL